MAEIDYLTASDVVALTGWFFERLGYAPPSLRGNGQALLESAVYRAQTAAFYGGADLIQQAASLANGILQNHPFLDGNKRCAWAACVAFLWLNGCPLPDEALDPLAEHLIAQQELTDRTQADELLADWLRAGLNPGARHR
ncbi:MAG TPA: type II toxin-antitoxin system death-on-curing family toxin [Chloroflexota bacterium]|nr:type II toxin-antitoxin system death-on-curing family toxin [Chloroflexota bacterium]